ncbi:secretin isoform X1 [Mixophyes fleayi]|uniref:secretin isoform X1 n=1 Tax=Mixophyes fleayi TaxID=3061075 RepID=UPI003F4E0ECE
MPLTMGLRALMILVVFLQLSCSSVLPARNKRHVDGMFTSEFSRARGSAAIRKIINSAMGGKSYLHTRDVEENGFQRDATNSGPQADSPRKDLSGLTYDAVSELRSEESGLNDVTERQLCSAILNLLYRAPYQSQQLYMTQDY